VLIIYIVTIYSMGKDDKLKCYTLKAPSDGHTYVTCDDKGKKVEKPKPKKLKLRIKTPKEVEKPKPKKLKLRIKTPKEAATAAMSAIKAVENISGSVKLKKQFIERLKDMVEKIKFERVLKATKDFEETNKNKRIDEILELFERRGVYGVLKPEGTPKSEFEVKNEVDYKKFNVSNPNIDGQRVEVVYVKTTGDNLVHAIIKFPVDGKGGSIGYYTKSRPRGQIKLSRKLISKLKLTKSYEKVRDELMELYGGETMFAEDETAVKRNIYFRR